MYSVYKGTGQTVKMITVTGKDSDVKFVNLLRYVSEIVTYGYNGQQC
jgi:hypothetical protein